MQRCGIEEVRNALENEKVSMLLVLRDVMNAEVDELTELALQRDIPVKKSSESDIWRMSKSTENNKIPPILALVGRNPNANIDQILEDGGIIWLLAGAQYPVNIGYTIRTAEVSGANAVFVDGNLSHKQKKAAKRASMKAHRFMPVHWVEGFDFVRLAKEKGFKIISIEDTGNLHPWESKLTDDVLLVIGGEHYGISEEILSISDQIIRIPMAGFVPSYNLQAPMAIMASEALRQRNIL
ncbi:MAG: hypothetical protein CL993_01475 [Euryarchaeota archaeon]|nr:hypothetical protein [Euryarchaeota archaeon]